MLVCTHCRIALREHETQCPRDGHPGEETTFADLPAELKSRFEVVEPFAQGLTGSLWLVDDRESGRRGLLKVLHASDAYRPADRQRIRREWTKQATLDSPHLARVFESGDADGQLWCLREWVDGVSLSARLSQGPMEQDDVLQMSGPLAAALDALHRAGLLHRDVKPGHIVLAPQPGDAPTKVVVVDAGSPSPLKGPGGERLWGTPAYMAPEQSAGKLVSFRSDLYSFGCVLYEALTGAPPFVDDDPLEVVRMHREHDTPDAPTGLPDDLAKLTQSLLAKEAQQRPFSAQKVRKSLAPHLAGDAADASATQTFATRGVAAFAPTSWSKPPANAKRPATSAPPPVPPAALSQRPSRGATSMAPPMRNGASVPANRGVSVPPPVPPAARKSSRPAASPMSTRPPSDATQPLELEQIVSMRANASAPPPPPPAGPPSTRSADHTQPVELDQIVAVNEFYGDAKRNEATDEASLPELEAEELEAEANQDGTSAEASGGGDETPEAPETDTRAEAQAPSPDESAAAAPESEPADLESTSAAEPEPSAVAAEPPADEEPAATVSEAVPSEATVSAAHLSDVRLPEEEPRPADDLVDAADDAAQADSAAPSFVDALAGPDADDDEEDESPTHVVSVRHVAAAAGMQAAAAGAAAVPPEEQPPPPTYWDDMNTGGTEPDAWGEPRATRQAETTKVTPNPFASPEQRNRLMMFGGGAVVLLALLIWMFSGDDEPELAQAERDGQGEQAEAEATTAAAVEPEAPSPAMAPAPKVEPQVEPKVEPEVDEVAEETADEAEEEVAEVEPEAPAAEEEEADEPARASDASKHAAAAPSPSRRRSPARSRSTNKPRRSASRGGVDTATWERARAEARAHYRMRKYDRAERAYAEAAAANPKHAGTFAGLGAARLAQGKARPAAQAYRHAVQLEPRNSAFHAALGAAYAQGGDKRRARREYTKALDLDKSNRAAKAGLAKL